MVAKDGVRLNEPDSVDFRKWIPVFPLPDVVLLPRAVLPLHIFEPRYRMMTHDALKGSRLIGMALLQPGYMSRYHTLSAPIHDVVCVSRILKEERLPDGRYHLLLQGLQRAKVLEENTQRPYRRAQLESLRTAPLNLDEEAAYRRQLRQLLGRPPLLTLIENSHWLELFECSAVGLSDLVDVLASAVLGGTEEKQAFLREPRVEYRAPALCDALRKLAQELEQGPAINAAARKWPPDISEN